MRDFKNGLRDGIPIALGYISVSFTFGLQAVSSGLYWWESVLISLTNLTSAGQFAGLDIMIRGGGFWVEMACAQLVINLRYSLMSLSLSQKADGSLKGIHRWLTGFGITDEIFAVAMGNKNDVSRYYLYGLILLPVLGWTSGTLLGAAAGQILPEVVRSSLGIAIYGMFIAIIIPPAKKNHAVLKVVVIAVVLSCAFKWLPLLNTVSSGFVIIICTVIAALVGAIFFPVKEGAE
ncbi:MAG: AzlC family ABC transporter permease [Acutalibacteraceae bacterium]